jgi:histidinol phosphatase-like PHP family hydrolase
MEIAFDCHVHTQRSACGEDITDQWLFQQARTREICFAVTDHTMHLYYEPEIAWAMYREDAIELFAARRVSGRERILRYMADLRSGNCPNLLVGVELDVLPDGQIMFPADLRGELDLCLGAIHLLPSAGRQADPTAVEAEQRQQTLWLLQYGVDVLAHPFRTMLSSGYEVDGELVTWTVEQAAAHGVALEVNSHKLYREHDLFMVRQCAELGVRLACGSDAHNTREFGVFDYHRAVLAEAGLSEAQLAELLFTPEMCGVRR